MANKGAGWMWGGADNTALHIHISRNSKNIHGRFRYSGGCYSCCYCKRLHSWAHLGGICSS